MVDMKRLVALLDNPVPQKTGSLAVQLCGVDAETIQTGVSVAPV